MVTKRQLYERGRRARPTITEAGAERIGEIRTQDIREKQEKQFQREASTVKKQELSKIDRKINELQRELKEQKQELKKEEFSMVEEEEQEGQIEGIEDAIKRLRKEKKQFKGLSIKKDYEKILANEGFSERLSDYAEEIISAREREERAEAEAKKRREEFREKYSEEIENLRGAETLEEYKKRYEQAPERVKEVVKSPEEVETVKRKVVTEREKAEPIQVEPGEPIKAEATEGGGVKITYGGETLAEQTGEGEVIDELTQQDIARIEGAQVMGEVEQPSLGEFTGFEEEGISTSERLELEAREIGGEVWDEAERFSRFVGIPVRFLGNVFRGTGERAFEGELLDTPTERRVEPSPAIEDFAQSLEGTYLESLSGPIMDFYESRATRDISEEERKKLDKKIEEKSKELIQDVEDNKISLEEANRRINEYLDTQKTLVKYDATSIEDLDRELDKKLDEAVEDPQEIADIINANINLKAKERQKKLENKALKDLAGDIQKKARNLNNQVENDKISSEEKRRRIAEYVNERINEENREVRNKLRDYVDKISKEGEEKIEESAESARIKEFLLGSPGMLSGAALTGATMTLLSQSSKLGALAASSEDIIDIASAAPQALDSLKKGDIAGIATMLGSLGITAAGGYLGGRYVGETEIEPRIRESIENARVESEVIGKGTDVFKGVRLPEDVESDIQTLIDRGLEVRKVKKTLEPGKTGDAKYLPDARSDIIEVINKNGNIVRRFSVGRAVSKASGREFTRDIIEQAAGKLDTDSADFITQRIEGRIISDKFMPIEEVRGLQESEIIEDYGDITEIETERFEIGRRAFERPASTQRGLLEPVTWDVDRLSRGMAEDIGRFPTEEQLGESITEARSRVGEPETRTRTLFEERTTGISAARTQPEVSTEDFWFGGPQVFRGVREFETVGRGFTLDTETDIDVGRADVDTETGEGMIGGGLFGEQEAEFEQETTFAEDITPTTETGTTMRTLAGEAVPTEVATAEAIGTIASVEEDTQERQFEDLAVNTQFEPITTQDIETDVAEDVERIQEPIVETDLMSDIAQDMESLQDVTLEEDVQQEQQLEQEVDIAPGLDLDFDTDFTTDTTVEAFGLPSPEDFGFGFGEGDINPYVVETYISNRWVEEGEAISYSEAFFIGAASVQITSANKFRIRIPGGREGAKEIPNFDYRDRFKRKVGDKFDVYILKNKQESTEDYWFG